MGGSPGAESGVGFGRGVQPPSLPPTPACSHFLGFLLLLLTRLPPVVSSPFPPRRLRRGLPDLGLDFRAVPSMPTCPHSSSRSGLLRGSSDLLLLIWPLCGVPVAPEQRADSHALSRAGPSPVSVLASTSGRPTLLRVSRLLASPQHLSRLGCVVACSHSLSSTCFLSPCSHAIFSSLSGMC